jgi:hypothetical protein
MISVAHFIYACYRQQYCSTTVNYSDWKCYNSFGYRLYNYVLPSVISVLVQSIVQAVNTAKAKAKSAAVGMLKHQNIYKYFCCIQPSS